MDSLPPASIPGSVLQRSNASRTMGQGGDAAVAIDMDHMDARPSMSNDMSQMQLVEQQVRRESDNGSIIFRITQDHYSTSMCWIGDGTCT